MLPKNYFKFLLTIALLLACSLGIVAQTGAPVGGQVLLKTPDGKTEPVVGALVEVYRTDIRARFPSDKTDKKGYFKFAALPFGATFVLSISGPGISPEIIPNVKAGMENMTINVNPGDGRKWTEDEVRQAIASKAVSSQTGELTAEQKKAEEERQRQIAEIQAKNKKAEETNRIINATLQEGSKAYSEKNYDLAIVKFEEGYQADPEFAGSAPVLLNNKALALIARGVEAYNKAAGTGDRNALTAAREAAGKDFSDAITASERALEILKNAASTDANVQKGYADNKYRALENRKRAYRLLAETGANRERGKEALVAFQEYMEAETDPAKKTKAQLELALTLQDSNEFELAIEEFEKILETDPNNADALVGIGLSLVNVGYINLDTDPAKGKAQLQEAANYLQRFVDIAPDTHKFKKDAKDTIASLKEQQKVTPQKGTPTRNTRRRN
jgi:tetratricopeptide (TPR) repeat protein